MHSFTLEENTFSGLFIANDAILAGMMHKTTDFNLLVRLNTVSCDYANTDEATVKLKISSNDPDYESGATVSMFVFSGSDSKNNVF